MHVSYLEEEQLQQLQNLPTFLRERYVRMVTIMDYLDEVVNIKQNYNETIDEYASRLGSITYKMFEVIKARKRCFSHTFSRCEKTFADSIKDSTFIH